MFNPYDPEFVRDPFPLLKRFREEQPIYYFEPAKGHIFFRYRDIMALYREPRLINDPTLGAGFPAELRAAFPDFVKIRENDLFVVSPQAHARIRKLVNPLFGPRAVEAHRERSTCSLAFAIQSLWPMPSSRSERQSLAPIRCSAMS